MLYADYEFYTTEYFGTAISVTDFPALCRQASGYIDRITYGRLKHGAPVTDEVRMATCAAAEQFQTLNKTAVPAPGVRAENTDGYSVTYADGASAAVDTATILNEAVNLYLPPSDPLRYAGGPA